MKLLGIASFFLAVLCVCTVGGDDISNSTTSAITSSTISKSVTEAVVVSTRPAITLQPSVLTTTVRATNPSQTVSTTNGSVPSSPSTTQKIRPSTTIQPTIKVTTRAVDKSDSTANATQTNGTQLAQNESSDASPTKGWSFSSTISLQNNTSTPGTSGFHMSTPTRLTTSGSPASTSGNDKAPRSDTRYSSVILPIVITLIVITLAVFSLVALYRMCQKKTPERQENGTEQAQSDKEGVKLLSVKTTSSETGSR